MLDNLQVCYYRITPKDATSTATAEHSFEFFGLSLTTNVNVHCHCNRSMTIIYLRYISIASTGSE